MNLLDSFLISFLSSFQGIYYQEEELLVLSPEWARHFRERFRARKAGAKRGEQGG